MTSKLLTPTHERYRETLELLAVREDFAFVTETNNASAAARIELDIMPRAWSSLLKIMQYKGLLYTVRAEPDARYFCKLGLQVRNVIGSNEPYITQGVRDSIMTNPSFEIRYPDLFATKN